MLSALLSLFLFAQPGLAESADAPEDDQTSLVLQTPAAPSSPRPAPAQVPRSTGGPEPTVGATTPELSAKATGTVTYREWIALPPNAVVQISLQDISRADAPAVVLGEQTITTGGAQVPIAFEIAYDPTAIDQRLTYSVRARITVDGQLLFASTTATLVITRGNPVGCRDRSPARLSGRSR
jgi:uncharacterized lipoprotein YbaY